VFQVAVPVFAALAVATAAGLAAPSVLGRTLASYELAALAALSAAVAWGLTLSRRRRERKRVLEMRDSALW
jgi:membrane protein implicated in regulation of membrane protease activity